MKQKLLSFFQNPLVAALALGSIVGGVANASVVPYSALAT